jgi:3-oxoacyl-[acyl-carrier-protein] synthase II
MKRRVAITGVGMVTPLGLDARETWSAMLAGRSGVGPITLFDASGFATRIAGEVRGFDPEVHLAGARHVAEMRRGARFCMAAVREAIADAHLDVSEDPEAIGVSIGNAAQFPSIDELLAHGACCDEHGHYDALTHGMKGIRPEYYCHRLFQTASSLVAINLGALGPNYSSTANCAASAQAVGLGMRAIRRGEAVAMICGGCDSLVSPLMLAGFCLMRALSRRNETPAAASRPFDRGRDGMVLGEGAGVLVLEEWEHARDRGARIYAEVLGYGTSSNAYRVTDVPEYGDGGVLSMQRALLDAEMAADRIDLVNAHGTSTPQNDRAETAAIKSVFGSHAPKLAVTANKSMLGHLIGASGAVELIVTALSLHTGIVPPTINQEAPDPTCDLDYVPNHARPVPVALALKNSFGFGGLNASVVLARPEEDGVAVRRASASRPAQEEAAWPAW